MITFHKFSPPPFEVVERKGIGHPDSLADGISEAISRNLSRAYLEEHGEILHHNVDKVLIIGGRAHPTFGGGRLIDPPTVIVGGRATVPANRSLDEIISKAASSHLRSTVPGLSDFRVEPRTREGAPELRRLIGRGANDTSIGVGYAPLNPVEEVVKDLEVLIRKVRGVGQDTKVMAVRRGEELGLVVAAAMVSSKIATLDEYMDAKERVRDAVLSRVDAEVVVNAADEGENIFLTVTGTSAEMGDDGATGRGNRVNGLITPMRPMTMEAVAGKNPVSHVGKIYNVIAQHAAEEVAELDSVEEAYVTLVSQIGAPLDQPMLRGCRIAAAGGDREIISSQAESIIGYWLERVDEMALEFVAGRIEVC